MRARREDDVLAPALAVAPRSGSDALHVPAPSLLHRSEGRPDISDLINALVGLLAAEAFLIGFLLQRLNELLDSVYERLREKEEALSHQPENLSLEEAVSEAVAAESAIKAELRLARPLGASWIVALAALMLAYGGIARELGGSNPWAWRELYTVVPWHWDLTRSSVVLLGLASAGLGLFGWWRVTTVRRLAEARLGSSGLAPILDCHEVWQAVGGSYVDADRFADRFARATSALFDRHPDWAPSHMLYAGIWFSVAMDARLLKSLDCEEVEALQRAADGTERALVIAPTNDWVWLWRAQILDAQADVAPTERDRAALLSAAIEAARPHSSSQALAPQLAVLRADLSRSLLDITPVRHVRRRATLQATIDEAFSAAFRVRSHDSAVITQWAIHQVDRTDATIGDLEDVVRQLLAVIGQAVSHLRTAPSNGAICEYVFDSDLDTTLQLLDLYRDRMGAARFQQLSAASLGSLLVAGYPIPDERLAAEWRTGWEPDAPRVLAQAIAAARRLENGTPVRALASFVRRPVRSNSREPGGRIAAAWEAIAAVGRLWLPDRAAVRWLRRQLTSRASI